MSRFASSGTAQFAQLSTLAYQSLPAEATDHATGIFNLFRTIGSSIGISVVSTFLSRASQSHWNQLGGHINPFNPQPQDWLAHKGLALFDPVSEQMLAHELERQASMQAFVDTFWLVTVSFLVLTPLLLFIGKRETVDSQGS